MRNGKIKGFIRFRTSCILSLGFCVLQMLDIRGYKNHLFVQGLLHIPTVLEDKTIKGVQSKQTSLDLHLLHLGHNLQHQEKKVINIYYNITLSTTPSILPCNPHMLSCYPPGTWGRAQTTPTVSSQGSCWVSPGPRLAGNFIIIGPYSLIYLSKLVLHIHQSWQH